MSGPGRQAQPASPEIFAVVVRELTVDYEQLDALCVSDPTRLRARLPSFEVHLIRKTCLLVERFSGDARDGARSPFEIACLDDDVVPVTPRKLS